MKGANLFKKVDLLKNKFSGLLRHVKQVKALHNYESTHSFRHQDYLILISRCLDRGFLGREEERFLEFMLKKYQVAYINWFRKTTALKRKLAKASPNQVDSGCAPLQLELFDYETVEKIKSSHSPFQFLMQNAKSAAPPVL